MPALGPQPPLMSVSVRLPVDVLRDIFEIVALADTPTAYSLSLVCSASRSWTEPILYHTVVLESARSLRAFAATVAVKSADFVTRRVLHLGIFAPGPFPAIHRVLAACAGVKSLACGFALPHYIKQFQRPTHVLQLREQHLLGISCRDGWDPTLLGCDATHLRLHLSPYTWAPARLADMKRLPALTHLAIVYKQSDGARALLPMLHDILTSLHLELLLIQVMGRPRPGSVCLIDETNRIALEELGNPRVVAEAAPFSTTRQWEAASRGEGSIWLTAEAVVEARLREE